MGETKQNTQMKISVKAEIYLQECKKKQESLVRVNDDVALLKAFHRRCFLVRVDTDLARFMLERELRKSVNLLRLCKKKELINQS